MVSELELRVADQTRFDRIGEGKIISFVERDPSMSAGKSLGVSRSSPPSDNSP